MVLVKDRTVYTAVPLYDSRLHLSLPILSRQSQQRLILGVNDGHQGNNIGYAMFS